MIILCALNYLLLINENAFLENRVMKLLVNETSTNRLSNAEISQNFILMQMN